MRPIGALEGPQNHLQDHQNHPQDHQNHQHHHQPQLVVVLGVVLEVLEVVVEGKVLIRLLKARLKEPFKP